MWQTIRFHWSLLLLSGLLSLSCGGQEGMSPRPMEGDLLVGEQDPFPVEEEPGDNEGELQAPGADPGQPPPSDSGNDPEAEVAPSSVRFVRVSTLQSPSWVAWSEIEVTGQLVGTPGPPGNCSGGSVVTASQAEATQRPERVVDGDIETAWNAGDFAPAWVQLELPAPCELLRVRLRVAQMPAGQTIHELSLGATEEELRVVQRFEGRTSLGDWLEFSPEASEQPVEPEPVDPPEVEPDPLEQVGKWRRKVLSFHNPSYAQNPFELPLELSFSHVESGETLTLPGYYDGDDTWRVGFMPTRLGEWRWLSRSPDPDLDGRSGQLRAVESGHPGLLAADPNHPDKWRYADGPLVVPIGVFVQGMLDDASLAQFIDMADFLHAHELQLINFRLSPHDLAFESVEGRRMDLALWRRLEQRMEILTERGLGVDVMLYTDDSGTPSFGPGSPEEQLLIRYAVARLAGYPVVLFNSGIDIAEFRDQAWVNWYGQHVQGLDPYGHPVSSRYTGGSGQLVMESQSYRSVGQRNSAIAGLLEAFHAGDGVPAANNDNWSEDMAGNNGHTVADLRRAGWKAVIAGGVAFHVRHNTLFCPRGITECDRYFPIPSVAAELGSASSLARVNRFVRDRLGEAYADMVPAPSLVDGGGGKYALAGPARERMLFMLMGVEDTWDVGDGGAIGLRLGPAPGRYRASWISPREDGEIDAGVVDGGLYQRLSPPSPHTWLLLLERL